MTNLKMVTWGGDLTQFLVEAATNEEAIEKAIIANKEFDKFCGSDNPEVDDVACYTVDNVSFDLLCEIIERDDWFKGKFGEAKVFND